VAGSRSPPPTTIGLPQRIAVHGYRGTFAGALRSWWISRVGARAAPSTRKDHRKAGVFSPPQR
jgi:hypothetical protein